MNNIPINPERRDPSTIQKKSDIGLSKVDNISSSEITALVLGQVDEYVNTGTEYSISNDDRGNSTKFCVLKLPKSCYFTLTIKLKSEETGSEQKIFEVGKYSVSLNDTNLEFKAFSSSNGGVLSSGSSRLVLFKKNIEDSTTNVLVELDLSSNGNIGIVEAGLSDYSQNIVRVGPNEADEDDIDYSDLEITTYPLTTTFGTINGVKFSETKKGATNVTITAKHAGSGLENAGYHNWEVINYAPLCSYVDSLYSTAVDGSGSTEYPGSDVNPGIATMALGDEVVVKVDNVKSASTSSPKNYNNKYGLVKLSTYTDKTFSKTSTASMIKELKTWVQGINDTDESVISLSLFKKFVSRLTSIISTLDSSTATYIFGTGNSVYSYKLPYLVESKKISFTVDSYKLGDTTETETYWDTFLLLPTGEEFFTISPEEINAKGKLLSTPCELSFNENSGYKEKSGQIIFFQYFSDPNVEKPEAVNQFEIDITQKARPWIRLYYIMDGDKAEEYYVDPDIEGIEDLDKTVSKTGTGNFFINEGSFNFTFRPVVHFYDGEEIDLSNISQDIEGDRFKFDVYSSTDKYEEGNNSTYYSYSNLKPCDTTIDVTGSVNGDVYKVTPLYTRINFKGQDSCGVIGNDSLVYKFVPIKQEAASPYIKFILPNGTISASEYTLSYPSEFTVNEKDVANAIDIRSNYFANCRVSSDSDWLDFERANTISGHEYSTNLTFKLKENKTAVTRTGTIEVSCDNGSLPPLVKYIRITQSNSEYDQSSFTFTITSLQFDAAGTGLSQLVSYTTSAISWNVKSVPDWISSYNIDYTNNKIKLTATENTGAYKRSGEVKVEYRTESVTKEAVLPVNQEEDYEEYILFNDCLASELQPFTFDYNSDSSSQLSVKTNSNWTVTTDQDWISVYVIGSFGSKVFGEVEKITTNDINFYVNSENSESKERTGKVIFTSNLTKTSVTISVRQLKTVNITLEQTQFVLNDSYESGITSLINIDDALGWTAVSDSDWLKLSVSNGFDNYSCSFTVSKNDTKKYRSGIITISSRYNSQFHKEIYVNQDPVFYLDTEPEERLEQDRSFAVQVSTNDNKGWGISKQENCVAYAFSDRLIISVDPPYDIQNWSVTIENNTKTTNPSGSVGETASRTFTIGSIPEAAN